MSEWDERTLLAQQWQRFQLDHYDGVVVSTPVQFQCESLQMFTLDVYGDVTFSNGSQGGESLVYCDVTV